jgi:DNA-binding transcriptional ArsR family regulator
MKQLDEQVVFEILSHPTRRKILRILTQEYYVNYSELQEVIGQSPGVIYHHLEKLREQGILQQRSTKEYELTSRGLNVVAYMDKIQTEELAEYVPRSSVQNIFVVLPIGKFIQKNPFHWAVEVGLVFIITTFIQLEFPIQIIGPFLIPSLESFLIRFWLQILSYFIMVALVFILAQLLASQSSTSSSLHLISGLLILPLLSSLASCLLWGITLLSPSIPVEIYWLVTILLHVGYTYLMIHLLVVIRKLSLERSIIITLVQGYIFLLFVFILG